MTSENRLMEDSVGLAAAGVLLAPYTGLEPKERYPALSSWSAFGIAYVYRVSMRARPGKPFIVGLLLAILCLMFLGWLSQEVLSGRTQAFDDHVRALVHQHASPALTRACIVLSEIGSPAGLMLMGAVVLIVLLLAQRKQGAVLFLVTMAGAFAIDFWLKLWFHRARPVSFFGYPVPRSYSFPSGHALFSVCFWGFLAAISTTRLRRRALRVLIWALAAALALAIGYSRIYLGVHYPSDVAAGYAAAVVWVSAVAYGHRLLLRRRARVPVLERRR